MRTAWMKQFTTTPQDDDFMGFAGVRSNGVTSGFDIGLSYGGVVQASAVIRQVSSEMSILILTDRYET